ncbi:MAG: hypothetical protein Q7K03_10950 [Dehalococcoidia bacterium]|nr:hypothetical protein [Dehalococcoidia bacterium]
MYLWKVVLGIMITVAVLSLTYGVANKINGLQQRLTLTEGILEGKVGDIRALQATLDGKNLQIGQLEVSEAGLKEQLGALQVKHTTLLQEKADLEVTALGLKTLSLDLQEKLVSKGKEYDALQGTYGVLSTANKALQVEHTTLLQEKAGLEVTVLGLKTISLDLQGKLDSKGKEYDVLSSAVGTLEGVKSQVSGLQQQVQSLNGDIARLQAARAPLIVESNRGSFACTGSMEPKITCLDEATWLSNFRPQEVIVGTVVSFTPTAECKLSSTRVAHRVTTIRVEAGTIYYRTKGDANSSDDGCWIPSSSVNGYIITLYKNTKLENAPIRDRINALKVTMDWAEAAYDAAHQIYEQKKVSYDLKLAAYQTYVTLYCPGNTCPVQYYSTAKSLFDELETLRLAVTAASIANNTGLAQYNTAYNSYWAAIEAERSRL